MYLSFTALFNPLCTSIILSGIVLPLLKFVLKFSFNTLKMPTAVFWFLSYYSTNDFSDCFQSFSLCLWWTKYFLTARIRHSRTQCPKLPGFLFWARVFGSLPSSSLLWAQDGTVGIQQHLPRFVHLLGMNSSGTCLSCLFREATLPLKLCFKSSQMSGSISLCLKRNKRRERMCWIYQSRTHLSSLATLPGHPPRLQALCPQGRRAGFRFEPAGLVWLQSVRGASWMSLGFPTSPKSGSAHPNLSQFSWGFLDFNTENHIS